MFGLWIPASTVKRMLPAGYPNSVCVCGGGGGVINKKKENEKWGQENNAREQQAYIAKQ
jgi:hypothetical protein